MFHLIGVPETLVLAITRDRQDSVIAIAYKIAGLAPWRILKDLYNLRHLLETTVSLLFHTYAISRYINACMRVYVCKSYLGRLLETTEDGWRNVCT